MRFAHECLFTLLMVTSASAQAEIHARCASHAGQLASVRVTNADLWLEQYRAFYSLCGNQAEFKIWDEMIAKPSNYPSPKSSNTKAVFKSAKWNQVEQPDEELSPKTTEIAKPVHRSSYKREKSAMTTKRNKALRASKIPVNATNSTAAPKLIRSVGVEGWRINCSARFGGFNKNSEWYISRTGKRVSCVIKP